MKKTKSDDEQSEIDKVSKAQVGSPGAHFLGSGSGSTSNSSGCPSVASASQADSPRKRRLESKDKIPYQQLLKSRGRGRNRLPEKLMDYLNQDVAPGVIWWLPGGEAFAFESSRVQTEFLDIYFRGTKVSSFIRSLNRWGFKRLFYASMPKSSICFHSPKFQKTKPSKVREMQLLSYTPQSVLAAEQQASCSAEKEGSEGTHGKSGKSTTESTEQECSNTSTESHLQARGAAATGLMQPLPSASFLQQLATNNSGVPSAAAALNPLSESQRLLLLQGLLANPVQAPVSPLNQRNQILANAVANSSLFPSLFTQQQQQQHQLLPSDFSASRLSQPNYSRGNAGRQSNEQNALLRLMLQFQQQCGEQQHLLQNSQRNRDHSQGRPPF